MTFDKEKTCCFTGHRFIRAEEKRGIETKTEEMVEELIKRGFDVFITGGALGFDTIAAECVLRLRCEHNIKLVIAVPCRDQSRGWKQGEKDTYEKILKYADEVLVLSEEYTPDCMHRRNRFMVDNSSACVAFMKKSCGGTFYTVSYAADNDREIIFVR